MSDVRKLQLEWWTEFRDALIASKVVPSAQSPRPQYWYNVALGRTGLNLSNVANTSDNKIGIRVYLRHKHRGDIAFAKLHEQREQIETEIGESLLWNPNENAQDKIIAIYRDADLGRRDKWAEYTQWMVDMTDRFRKAFGQRVKQLNLDVSEDDDES